MKTIRLIALVIGLLSGISGASAQGDSEVAAAQRLLATARQATGGAAWDQVHLLHQTMKLSAGGLDGTVESWAEPARGRYASHFTLGPDRGAEGWDVAGAWNADWAGRVHRFEPAEQGGGVAIWQSYAYLFPERSGLSAHALGRRRDESGNEVEVIRLAAPGRGSVELWLDAVNALPRRLVLKGSPDLVVTLADYRDVQGVKLPGTMRASTGVLRYDHVTSLDKAEFDPAVTGNPFEAPAPAPPDYHFAPGETRSTSLMVPTGDAFLIDVTINGKGPYRFALDTGASNAIDTDLAAELGLPVSGALSATGAGELPVDIGLTRAAQVEIGDVALTDQLFRVLPLSRIVAGDRPAYRGLLGYEFFDRFVVRLDQDRHEVVLSEPQGWSFRGTGVSPVHFQFHGRMPAVDGQIDLVPGRFTLDTGQANSLTLYRPFMLRTGIQRKYVPKLSAIVGEGVGGPIRAEVARGQKLVLGETVVSGPVVFLSQQKTGAFSDPDLAGNIGGGVFLRFSTTFDYARRQVWFERTPTYGYGDGLKLMTVKRSFNGFLVLSVLPGGPMDEAGLKRNDVIELIDYKNATTLDDLAMEKIFRKPAGTKVHMTVRSDGALKDLTVVLSEIV